MSVLKIVFCCKMYESWVVYMKYKKIRSSQIDKKISGYDQIIYTFDVLSLLTLQTVSIMVPYSW